MATPRAHSLLLLPPPPVPSHSAAIAAAYRPSIAATITALKAQLSCTELLIAVPCPEVHGELHGPRSCIYSEVQGLLATVYSLICLVCAEVGADVESDAPGAIDARVLLLDYDPARQSTVDRDVPADGFICGPIIDLPTLALTRRNWHTIYAVDGEPGQEILGDWLKLARRTGSPSVGEVQVVSGGVSLVQREEKVPSKESSSAKPHHVVAVGGTFDNLHAGHKLLLTAIALILQPATADSPGPQRLVVGISGDGLLKKKKYREFLGSWEERQQGVVGFLRSILYFTGSPDQESGIQTTVFEADGSKPKVIHTLLVANRIQIECVEFHDTFGPTATDASISALVVSGETRAGGQAVNEKRAALGWTGLEVFEVDVLDAEASEGISVQDDFASKISSSAIRRRKAERGGLV